MTIRFKSMIQIIIIIIMAHCNMNNRQEEEGKVEQISCCLRNKNKSLPILASQPASQPGFIGGRDQAESQVQSNHG